MNRRNGIWHSNSSNGDFTKYLSRNDPKVSVKSVASGLSYYLRTSSENNRYNVTRFAVRQDTIVNVTWAWITLPLVLQLTTVLFFVMTMHMSSKKMLGKSSNAALLLYGLNNNEVENSNSRRGDLQKREKTSTMKIQKNDSNWQLVVEERHIS